MLTPVFARERLVVLRSHLAPVGSARYLADSHEWLTCKYIKVTIASCAIATKSAHSCRRRRSCSRLATISTDASQATHVEAAILADLGSSADPPKSGTSDALSRSCVLVINLARRADRLQCLERVLSAGNPGLWQHVERIDAVDGKGLKLDDEAVESFVQQEALLRARRAKSLGMYTVVHDADNNLVHFDDHLTEGAIACAMSHRKALERVAAHPTADWGLILEDDISVVVPQVEQAIALILQQLPSDWNAVFLGYHHEHSQPHPLGRSTLRPGNTTEVADVQVFEIHKRGPAPYVWGLYAWMVRKDAARAVAEGAFPIRGQVDYAISSWLVRERGGVFCVPPHQCLFYSPSSEEGQDSDIQSMAEDAVVVEQHGSWGDYMRTLKEPTGYDELDEDYMYEMLGEYGLGADESEREAYGSDGDVDPAEHEREIGRAHV